MTATRIAVIGAGSAQFSACIVRDLCVTPALAGSEICLMDVDAHRLALVEKLAHKIDRELGSGLRITSTTDRAAALRDTAFVINTALDGGHPWAEYQRSLAEKHGFYRGAHLSSFTNMALMLEIAQDMERLCPQAWLIQSSNPVFEGCTLMTRETGIRVVGLCHGHTGYERIAEVMGLDLKDVSAKTIGFNHWIFMTEFTYKGQDAYPLLDKWIETEAERFWAQPMPYFHDTPVSRAAMHQYKLFGLMPIGDTPRMCDIPRVLGWWYLQDLETRKKWYGPYGGFDSEIGWDKYLHNLEQNLRDIEQVTLDDARRATDTFEPVRSDEQIVPLIETLVHDGEALYHVNIPNRGPILRGIPEDVVVECDALVRGGEIVPLPQPQLPRKVIVGAMLPRLFEAETMIEAVARGDLDLIRINLLADHRTQSLEQVDAMLEEWLADPRCARLANRLRPPRLPRLAI